jgi:hypothetical protein
VRQKASVDSHSVGRDHNRVAGDGADDLQERFRCGRAASRCKVSSAATELGGSGRYAHRDDPAAFDSTLRKWSEAINAERHARREIEVDIDCRDRLYNEDDQAGEYA